MAIAVASVSTGSSAGGNYTVPVPTGTASGDLLVAIGLADPDGTTWTAPAGWTNPAGGNLAGANGDTKVWWKVATGSEGTSYTWTADANSARTTTILRLTGADTTTPIDVIGTANDSATGTTRTAPSVTATVAGLLVCGVGAHKSAGGGGTSTNLYTPPSGMTEQSDLQDSTGWESASVATLQLSATGATGAKTFTISSATFSAGGGAAVSLVIKPASSGGSTFSASSAAASTSAASGSLTAALVTAGLAASLVVAAGAVTSILPTASTAPSTSSASGSPTSILPSSGAAACSSAATGTPTGLLIAAGSASSTSMASGSAGTLAGAQSYPASGSASSASAASGAVVSRLLSASTATSASGATGQAKALYIVNAATASISAASGSPTVIQNGALTASGVAASTSGASGSPQQRMAASSTGSSTATASGLVSGIFTVAGSATSASAATGVAGLIVDSSGFRDVTVLSVAEVARAVGSTEAPRPLSMTEVPRPFSASIAEGGAVDLNVKGREFYQLTIVTDPPVSSWEASFDNGATWVTGEPVIRIANTWRWLVAGSGFTADSTPASVISGHVKPLVRATDSPEVIVRRVPDIYLNQ